MTGRDNDARLKSLLEARPEQASHRGGERYLRNRHEPDDAQPKTVRSCRIILRGPTLASLADPRDAEVRQEPEAASRGSY
jgi:hypothetical protein